MCLLNDTISSVICIIVALMNELYYIFQNEFYFILLYGILSVFLKIYKIKFIEVKQRFKKYKNKGREQNHN